MAAARSPLLRTKRRTRAAPFTGFLTVALGLGLSQHGCAVASSGEGGFGFCVVGVALGLLGMALALHRTRDALGEGGIGFTETNLLIGGVAVARRRDVARVVRTREGPTVSVYLSGGDVLHLQAGTEQEADQVARELRQNTVDGSWSVWMPPTSRVGVTVRRSLHVLAFVVALLSWPGRRGQDPLLFPAGAGLAAAAVLVALARGARTTQVIVGRDGVRFRSPFQTLRIGLDAVAESTLGPGRWALRLREGGAWEVFGLGSEEPRLQALHELVRFDLSRPTLEAAEIARVSSTVPAVPSPRGEGYRATPPPSRDDLLRVLAEVRTPSDVRVRVAAYLLGEAPRGPTPEALADSLRDVENAIGATVDPALEGVVTEARRQLASLTVTRDSKKA